MIEIGLDFQWKLKSSAGRHMIPRPNYGPILFFCQKSIYILNKVLGQSITFTLPSLPVWFLILHHASLVNIHNSNHLSFPISSKLYLVYWFYVSVFKKLLKALFHYIYPNCVLQALYFLVLRNATWCILLCNFFLCTFEKVFGSHSFPCLIFSIS